MDRKKLGWIFQSLKVGLKPRVKHKLHVKGLPTKAKLLMDNAPSNPTTGELYSQDGFIKTLIVWEKFGVKKFSSDARYDEN